REAERRAVLVVRRRELVVTLEDDGALRLVERDPGLRERHLRVGRHHLRDPLADRLAPVQLSVGVLDVVRVGREAVGPDAPVAGARRRVARVVVERERALELLPGGLRHGISLLLAEPRQHLVRVQREALEAELGRRAAAERRVHERAERALLLRELHALLRRQDAARALGAQRLDAGRAGVLVRALLGPLPARVGDGVVQQVAAELLPRALGILRDERGRRLAGREHEAALLAEPLALARVERIQLGI